jgi:23S rRNA-/tRNA-specific pseudouridylate synthase
MTQSQKAHTVNHPTRLPIPIILNPLSGQTSQEEALTPNEVQLCILHSDNWLMAVLNPTTVPAIKNNKPTTAASTTTKKTLM